MSRHYCELTYKLAQITLYIFCQEICPGDPVEPASSGNILYGFKWHSVNTNSDTSAQGIYWYKYRTHWKRWIAVACCMTEWMSLIMETELNMDQFWIVTVKQNLQAPAPWSHFNFNLFPCTPHPFLQYWQGYVSRLRRGDSHFSIGFIFFYLIRSLN